MATTITPAFAGLLAKAVSEPGTLSSAYSQFHDYSLGNVLLAAFQCQARAIPLGPMATYPRWKELGRHVKKTEQAETETTPRSLREAEAESVALLCCDALGLPGAEESRGCIQHWYGAGNPIPERSAQRIFRVADQILRAGQLDPEGGR